MNTIKTCLIILLILISLATNSQSKEPGHTSDDDWLISLEEYFFNLGNVKGKFTQIDQIGNITKGTFYSNGKGSIKFE